MIYNSKSSLMVLFDTVNNRIDSLKSCNLDIDLFNRGQLMAYNNCLDLLSSADSLSVLDEDEAERILVNTIHIICATLDKFNPVILWTAALKRLSWSVWKLLNCGINP